MKLLRDQKGMALLLVLVIVALLTALLTEFSFSTLVDLRATETFRDRTKAYYLARGGIEAARMILREDRNNWDHPSEFWGEELPTVPVGEGDVRLKIVDLSGRFNLNGVADRRGSQLPGYSRFLMLCEEVLEIDRAEAKLLGDALVNWLNGDRTKVTDDDGYYAGLNPPYPRKGADLDTVDELLLVRYFDAGKVRRLQEFVRVVGDEPINLNSASAEVLYAWQFNSLNAPEYLDRQEIAAIVDYRQQAPLETRGDLNRVPGINPNWSVALPESLVKVTGDYYQVTSSGRINQGIRRAEAVIQKNGNIQSLKVE
jgi:general secretion pathway protein K